MIAPVWNAVAMAVGIWLVSLEHVLIHPLLYILAGTLCLVCHTSRALKALIISALLGACLMSWSLGEQRAAERTHAESLDDRESEQLRGTIVGPSEIRAGRQRVLLQSGEHRIWLTVFQEDDHPHALLLPGQRVSLFARLGRPVGLRGLGTANRRLQVMARGASLVASASAADVRTLGWESSLWRPAMRAHQRAVSAIGRQNGSEDGRAIVAAIATGERSLMSEPLLAAVRASGLAHLLAVSGMHMAAVVSLAFLLVRWLWCFLPWRQVREPKAVAAGVALLAAVFFTALTGARPSTTRALLVASLVLVGIMLDLRMSLLSALAWAAMGLLGWRPALLFDVGFQMSFAATTALALAFAPRLRELRLGTLGAKERVARALWSLALASFWASFATAPIAMWHFGEVSGLAIIANVIAVPVVTIVVLPLALLGILLVPLSTTLADLVLHACVALAEIIAWSCYRLEELVPMQARAPLNRWEFVIWLAALALLLWRRKPASPWWQRRVQWLGLAACVGLGLHSRSQGPQSPDSLRITFVEIGQGDAAVIEVPGGEVWLVDGGGLPFVSAAAQGDKQRLAEAPARRALLPFLRHRRIEKIDLAIVSHPHPDHYVGLQAVARELPIRELWSVHEKHTIRGPYERWLSELATSGTLVRAPHIGHARRAGRTSLEVLWPLFSDQEPAPPDRVAQGDPVLTVNDNSLVVRLSAAGRSVLFAGDIEEEAEQLLVMRYGDGLRADVLKVPHHGSRTSSTTAFAQATRPLVAVISCGRANRFDFPAPEVVTRWTEHADHLLRTDNVGSVTVEIADSGRMRVQTAEGF